MAYRHLYEADFLKATARLSSMIQGYDWTIEDTYAAQNMCPYETVSTLESRHVRSSVPSMAFPTHKLTLYCAGCLWLQSFLRSLHL